MFEINQFLSQHSSTITNFIDAYPDEQKLVHFELVMRKNNIDHWRREKNERKADIFWITKIHTEDLQRICNLYPNQECKLLTHDSYHLASQPNVKSISKTQKRLPNRNSTLDINRFSSNYKHFPRFFRK